MDMFFEMRKLKVKITTPIVPIMSVLGEAGVLIDGRYTLHMDESGTFITYLATDLQEAIISEAIRMLKERGMLNSDL